jgi:catechol 2,3-dioxygenase-like lactoylglutathione lyase family enzyme
LVDLMNGVDVNASAWQAVFVIDRVGETLRLEADLESGGRLSTRRLRHLFRPPTRCVACKSGGRREDGVEDLRADAPVVDERYSMLWQPWSMPASTLMRGAFVAVPAGHCPGLLALLRHFGKFRYFQYSRIVEEKVVIKSLAALAQPLRLQVFRALVVTGEAGLTPGTMSDALEIPPNTLSFHLKELTKRRPGDPGAFEQEHRLPGGVRPHEFAARLSHRQLLPGCCLQHGRSGGVVQVLITKENPMKRFHVHAHVDDLPASIAFYTKLFGADPARVEPDYAKWMVEDPRINFAISTRGREAGRRPPRTADRHRRGTRRTQGSGSRGGPVGLR